MPRIDAEQPHPTLLNASLVLAFAALCAWVLWLLPAGPLQAHPALAWTLLPATLLTTSLWSVIHETIHGCLFRPRPLNDAAGRVLCILFGAPLRVLAFGHLFHHRRNRSELDSTEMYDPKRQRRLAAALPYYFRLLGGLYLTELAACLLVWLPQPLLLRRVTRRFDAANLPEDSAMARKLLSDPMVLRELRLDSAAILFGFGLSLWLYGQAWPLLAMTLLGRGLLISLMDNAYHYGTPLDAPRYALNLDLPAWLSAAILHFNLHRVHHRHPVVSWRELPRLFWEECDHADGSYMGLVLRQLRGPQPLPAKIRGESGG